MTMNTNVILDSHFSHYIEGLVQSGRYANTSEVIRDSLRLLEEKENQEKLKVLRQALEEGELSGEPESFNLTKFLTETRKSVDGSL